MTSSLPQTNTIPPITDELGKYWKQPPISAITIDDKYAMMAQHTFDALAEYSSSQPSGVYEGKMWKRNDGIYDRAFVKSGGKPTWLLCWYGHSEKPGHVSNNSRIILIV